MDIKDVLQLTSSELFIPDLKATDKAGVLTEMAEALIAATPISNHETILDMLVSREQLGSTAVGPGVAFPHGRSLAVQNLIIVIARSTSGVDFESVDGAPTHLFFMLIAPPQDSGNQYIKSLAVLTDRMQDDDLRKALQACDSYPAFSEILMEGQA